MGKNKNTAESDKMNALEAARWEAEHAASAQRYAAEARGGDKNAERLYHYHAEKAQEWAAKARHYHNS